MISITERSGNAAFSVPFEREEMGWLLEHSKKTSGLERHLGFNGKFKGKTRTHLW